MNLLPDWRINNDYNRTTQLIVSYKEGKKVSHLYNDVGGGNHDDNY